MLSVIFVILTLALVMFLVFKKVNIVIASIIASIVLAVLDGQNVVTAMSETFMTGTANYVKNFFLLFFVSALFGKVMESTGAAAAIARGLANLLGEKFAILGVLFAGMVLTYGGISALVIAFTMYPLTLAVFKRANMPRRLIPGAIAAGCFTFAAAALPGTPQTLNVTPIPYLGTTVTAGAAIGIICGIIGIVMICVYMYWEAARARAAGDGFVADTATLETMARADEMGANINPFVALIPILVIIVLLVACGALSLGLNHYRDNVITYKAQRDKKARELEQANATITDMQVRQRDVAALDAKYSRELADARAENETLRADVAAGRKRLRINATCSGTVREATGTSGVDNATGPRLADTAERDYFILRERLMTMQKQLEGAQDYIRTQCLN